MTRFWRDPNTWIGIGLAAVVIPMLIWAIVHHVRRGPEDNDFMTVLIGQEDIPLTPRFPSGSDGVWKIVSDDTVDHGVILLAVKRWNSVLGFKALEARQDQTFFDDPNYVLSNEYKFGHITISVATEPGGENCGGITHHNYDKATGEVYWSEITINPMYTNDEDSYLKAVVHELGHAAFMLAHDDHPDSIMRKRLNTCGKITAHDLEIVRKLWTQYRPVTL